MDQIVVSHSLMNILFILKYHQIGGIEIVSRQLANIFAEKGHNVAILSLDENGTLTQPPLNECIKFYNGFGFSVSAQNVNLLRNILINDSIDVVINQWGLPYQSTVLFKKASKGLKRIKYISAYHNDPTTNGRTKLIEEQLLSSKNGCSRLALRLKLLVTKFVTGLSMNYVYRNSDHYLLLSESFVEGFKRYAFNDGRKVVVCPNPLTIDFPTEISLSEKKKEILYVGRMELNQKRVDRVLEIWKDLYERHPQWKLTLVGDGVDREKLEASAKIMKLKNFSFEGFQNPKKYYKNAQFLLLTSDYEGFGLVLIEAMAYGVIPIGLGSYHAIYDIIDNGKNGFVTKLPFDKKDFITVIEKLIMDDCYKNEIAKAAIGKSRTYSDKSIYEYWFPILREYSAED